VTAQILDRILIAYRIGDPGGAYPIFDATGSRLYPGRWNTASSPMIYASEHFSTALLEQLVHGSGRLPRDQHYVEIAIPPGVTYETFETVAHPGWDAADATVAKAYGTQWQHSKRSLLLLVPSVVARLDRNVLIHQDHPEFHRITHSLHKPVYWDRRLLPSMGDLPQGQPE